MSANKEHLLKKKKKAYVFSHVKGVQRQAVQSRGGGSTVPGTQAPALLLLHIHRIISILRVTQWLLGFPPSRPSSTQEEEKKKGYGPRRSPPRINILLAMTFNFLTKLFKQAFLYKYQQLNTMISPQNKKVYHFFNFLSFPPIPPK